MSRNSIFVDRVSKINFVSRDLSTGAEKQSHEQKFADGQNNANNSFSLKIKMKQTILDLFKFACLLKNNIERDIGILVRRA